MNPDIRMSTGYPDHPKTRKLLRKLGAEGIKSHIFLLCKIGHLRPKGLLAGFEAEDIEDTAQWTGEPGAFFEALLEVRFLDKKPDGTYEIHDWPTWNPWAFGSEERKARGQHAARSRWGKQNKPASPAPAAPAPPPPASPATKPERPRPEPRKSPPAATEEVKATDLIVMDEEITSPAVVGELESPKSADLVLASWNVVAKKKGLKTARRLSPGRRAKINIRLRDKGWEWQAALAHLEKRLPNWADVEKRQAERTFLQGGGTPFQGSETPWVADFDFFIRGDSVDKILDGKYDHRQDGLAVAEGGMSKRNQDMMEEHKQGSSWASRKEEALGGKPAIDS